MIYLIWTCDDLWELPFLLILTLHYSFNDARMIRAQIHEAVSDSSFPDGLEKGKRCSIHPICGQVGGSKLHRRSYMMSENRVFEY